MPRNEPFKPIDTLFRIIDAQPMAMQCVVLFTRLNAAGDRGFCRSANHPVHRSDGAATANQCPENRIFRAISRLGLLDRRLRLYPTNPWLGRSPFM